MQTSTTGIANGWGKPKKSRVWHYFRDSFSLCGKWSYFGSTDSGVPMHKRCAACEKLRTPGAF